MSYVITILASLTITATAVARPCNTHEVCTPPASCTCTAPARSAGVVYYYFDIPVQRDHQYRCTFSGEGYLSVLPEGSTFPAGAADTWDACCQFRPAVLRVDTVGMRNATDTVVVKYMRGASSYPFTPTLQCSVD